MSLFDSASLVVTPNGYKEDKLYSIKPTDGSGDLVVTRATTATRVNSSGLIESVATNVPRLDYTNSSCPSILVEPQRTNVVTYSEQFDNVNWVKLNATITANTSVAPTGNTTADTLTITSGGYLLQTLFGYNAISGQSITISIFAKNQISDFLKFGGATTAGNDVYTIQDYGNGWYRHIRTRTFTTSNPAAVIQFIIFDTIGTHIVWGAQMEANSTYATSYIPTIASSVTRNTDVISKTGISSLIGQTEGTMFFDIVFPQKTTPSYIGISDGTTGNRIILGCESDTFFTFGYGFDILPLNTNTRYKIAMAYNSTNMKIYANGNLLKTVTGSVPSGLSRFAFDSGGDSQNLIASVKTCALFKTKLSDSELAQLTTI